MRESYSSATGRSSPAPPELPPPPPAKFQFSLKQLLAYMVVSAVLAAVIHYLLRELGQLPTGWLDGIVGGTLGVILIALVVGATLYCLLRLPVLLVRGGQLFSRWRILRQHRRDLATWAKSRAKEANKPEDSGPPQNE